MSKLIYISCPSGGFVDYAAESYAQKLEAARWRVLRWWEPSIQLLSTNDAHKAILRDYAMIDEVIAGGGIVWVMLSNDKSEGTAAEATYVALKGGRAVISGTAEQISDPTRVAFHQRFTGGVDYVPGIREGYRWDPHKAALEHILRMAT